MTQIFLLVAVSILTTVGAHLCFKQGVLKMGSLDFSFANIFALITQILQNFWVLFGIVLFGISFLLWLFIISKLQLNIIYPVVISLEVSLVTVGSWFLFREYLTLWQVLGIAVILAGIFLLLKP
jgi:multidrug transporter EmrE-like cation transporter